MDHAAFLVTIREQSERFLEALAGVPADVAVPSCPGWTAADLLRHLGEVQHHWALVAAGAGGDEVPEPERPVDVGDLGSFVASAGTDLIAALADRGPGTPCWSWHPDGGTIGWVARRQAHEALVHRVDAELTAGLDVRPPSVEVAVDGVDEVLTVFVDGVPDWGAFARDGIRVRLSCTNAPASWLLELGHFTGTGPQSGTEVYLDAAAVRPEVLRPDGFAPLDPPVDALVAGHAWDLDRWLWGRGDLDAVDVTGELALLERVRALLVDATQ